MRDAADVLRPEYDRTAGRHGFVSLEVDPHLAHDTRGTIAEARRLWRALDRPNVFIKVPATAEGLPAIAELIGEGINVNVTLLFGLPRYREVAEAYLQRTRDPDPSRPGPGARALRRKLLPQPHRHARRPGTREGQRPACRRGPRPARPASPSPAPSWPTASTTRSSTASRFAGLAAAGAHPQHLLWASTGTKDPALSDTYYVEPLIGPETINTMPRPDPRRLPRPRPARGEPRQRSRGQARDVLRTLADAGIDLDDLTGRLTDQGIDKFILPYTKLMTRLREARKAAGGGRRPRRRAVRIPA